MPTVRFTLPRNIVIEAAIEFALKLQNPIEADTVVLDAGAIEWSEPFGMLYLSAAICDLRSRRPDLKVYAENFTDQTYLLHMGFFQQCGFKVGKKPGQATGSDTYLPITTIDLSEIARRAAVRGLFVQDEIESVSKRLTSMLLQKEEGGDLFDTLNYAFRELGRNVVEHSQSKSMAFCAQYWPTKNHVEVCIVDGGVGIFRTIHSNPYLEITSDADAVNAALLPGISGKAIREELAFDNPWENSGYGLYMMSRLCADGGSFFMASGTSGIRITNHRRDMINVGFNGTSVRLFLNIEKLRKLEDMLRDYAKEGSAIAREITGKADANPSRASLMVRRLFCK